MTFFSPAGREPGNDPLDTKQIEHETSKPFNLFFKALGLTLCAMMGIVFLLSQVALWWVCVSEIIEGNWHMLFFAPFVLGLGLIQLAVVVETILSIFHESRKKHGPARRGA